VIIVVDDVAGVVVVDVTERGLVNGSNESNTIGDGGDLCDSCCCCCCCDSAGGGGGVRGRCGEGRIGRIKDGSSTSSPHSQSELESPPPPPLPKVSTLSSSLGSSEDNQ